MVKSYHLSSSPTVVPEAEIMAANFVSASKAIVLLALCFIVICKTVCAGPQHTCAYPQACTNPGANDPSHVVTSTARYNPTTKKCETIPSETGPHNCQKFATIADCQKNCANA
ncbi:secreted salivary gland peptide, putative [Ixodes scapularis]|uniref:Secreted salivary gland peptide, putative n=1 Tax=Ixodes scapularis TaxID=6945 RepID=B7PFR2_IXOSC|nr:secreted salivary gland peptide, putative [Ixodes scapularis]|eukprot:XP_002434034.1 secreted salivary gland peptide, putative [Ixodes scapularis]